MQIFCYSIVLLSESFHGIAFNISADADVVESFESVADIFH